MSVTEIRAAGGLLWRPSEVGPAAGGATGRPAEGAAGSGNEIEVAVVHRLRYDDWSLPKGKLDPGEEPLLAAVREVNEETGRRVTVGRHLATVHYDVGDRGKAVQYWAMRDAGPFGDGAILDTDEVADLEWLTPADALGRLTYPDDRRVLHGFRRLPWAGSVLVLVRHARAGKRSEWSGPDDLRPLDERGRAQAEALADLLANFGPTAVFAADRVRCAQTVEPLAARFGTVPTALPAVSDEAFAADPAAALAALGELSVRAAVTVVCSQGAAIPGVLDAWLPPRLRTTVPGLETRKAAWWVLGLQAGVPVWVDRYDRPATTRAP